MDLKDYLISAKEPMAEFASKLGVTAQYIWTICNKQRLPSLFLAKRIQEISGGGVTLDELMGREVKSSEMPKCCPTCKRRFHWKKCAKDEQKFE